MNELALFAGAGGGILGGHLLRWRTVCAVEWEQYPASVLCARQNDGILPTFPIWDDVQTFDGKPWRGIVDVVSGGFPCQDISAAGKGAGIDGERSGMWSHMARIIGEVRPRYAFIENSPMLTIRGLESVLADLAKMGFDAEWGVLSAADVGANHLRERIWIVGKNMANTRCELRSERNATELDSNQEIRAASPIHNQSSGTGQGNISDTQCQRCKRRKHETGCQWDTSRHSEGLLEGDCQEISNTSSIGLSRQRKHEQSFNSTKEGNWKTDYVESIGSSDFWEVEPNMGRVADGVAASMDRLKAIGNGQVPLCAATAFKLLRERIER